MNNKKDILNDKTTSAIVERLEEKIEKIMNIEYHHNLFEIFGCLSNNKDSNSIYETLINNYLNKLSKLNNKIVLKLIFNNDKDSLKIKNFCDERNIIEYFDYNSTQDKDNNVNSEVGEEASTIAYDLVAKVIGKNNRSISLPITIQNIRDFSISSIIKESEIEELFAWIVLYLSVIYNYSKFCIEKMVV